MIFKNSKSKIISRLFVVISEQLFMVIRGHIFTVINGHRPVNLKDYRNRLCVTSSNDGREGVFGNDWCLKKLLDICCKFFKYPSPADKSATSPSRGEVYNNRHFSVIRGHRPANLDPRVGARGLLDKK